MNKIMQRFRSDDGAANTTETIILIALAVFAAFALFRFVLSPVQQGADKTGKTITSVIDNLLGGKDPDTGQIIKP